MRSPASWGLWDRELTSSLASRLVLLKRPPSGFNLSAFFWGMEVIL